PEAPAATITIWGLLAVAAPADARPRHPLLWLALGAMLALLPWLHAKFLLPMALLYGIALLRWRGQAGLTRRLGLMLAPLAPSFLLMAVLSQRWYGNPWPPRPRPSAPLSPQFLADGLPGMLIDREYGLLVWAPIYAVALAALVVGLARRWPLAGQIAL